MGVGAGRMWQASSQVQSQTLGDLQICVQSQTLTGVHTQVASQPCVPGYSCNHHPLYAHPKSLHTYILQCNPSWVSYPIAAIS